MPYNSAVCCDSTQEGVCTASPKERGRRQAATNPDEKGAESQYMRGMHRGGGGGRQIRGQRQVRQQMRREIQIRRGRELRVGCGNNRYPETRKGAEREDGESNHCRKPRRRWRAR